MEGLLGALGLGGCELLHLCFIFLARVTVLFRSGGGVTGGGERTSGEEKMRTRKERPE